MNEPTYGELLVKGLLESLPTDRFFAYAEPRIDHSIKSSRYPDFVLVDRQHGVICIEIKDWKKIEAEDQRTIRVFDKNNSYRREDSPYDTAREYAFQLQDKFMERRELLDEKTSKKRLSFPIEPLVILTHQTKDSIRNLVENGIFKNNQVLGADDISSTQNLLKALKKLTWTFSLKEELSDSALGAMQKTIAVLEIRSKTLVENNKRLKFGMITEDQENIIWSPIPFLDRGYKASIVRGVAGSGKTEVLTKKAMLLADLRPDLNILITAFNIDLASNIQNQMKEVHTIDVYRFYDLVKKIMGNDYPQYWEYRGYKDPRSVKSWCEEFLTNDNSNSLPTDFISQEISRRKELCLSNIEQYIQDLNYRGADLTKHDIEEIDASFNLYIEYQEQEKREGKDSRDYEDTALIASRKIVSPKNPFRQKYDVIMVDEGQDFSSVMLNILRSMLKVGGYLFICDDPIQTLWREYDLLTRGLNNAHRYYLNLPLRTTKQIADLAQSLFELVPDIRSSDDSEIYPAPTENLQIGEMPSLIQFKTPEEEEEYLVQSIQEKISNGCFPRSIGVLTPLHLKDFGKKIGETGCYYGHFNIMKGLEFTSVYIAHLDDLFFSKWNSRGIMRRMHYRKLFVAITRARKELTLTICKPLPYEFETIIDYCQFIEM